MTVGQMETIVVWDEASICPECGGFTMEDRGSVICKLCGLIVDRSIEVVRSVSSTNMIPGSQPFEWWFGKIYAPIKLKNYHDIIFFDNREHNSKLMYKYFRMLANSLNIDGFIFFRGLYIANKLLEEYGILPKLSATIGIFMSVNEYRLVRINDIISGVHMDVRSIMYSI